MKDSLAQQHVDLFAGIPDTGTRVAALVIVTFLLVILCVLLAFKMKESDRQHGTPGKEGR